MYCIQEDAEVQGTLSSSGGGGQAGEEEPEQFFAAELQRGQRGFGFSIRGGREFHSMPLFVLRMAVDGEAQLEVWSLESDCGCGCFVYSVR